METYRNFRIYYDPPPIPVRSMDWHYVHVEFDGAPDGNDHRFGHAASMSECLQEIDDWYAELYWPVTQAEAAREHAARNDRDFGSEE